jgi:RNA polymerase sigma-70 factor (ECF subfamily)
MPRTLDPDAIARHLERLRRAARGMTGNPVDADDLVQETCARVLARPRRIHHEDDVAYLLRALRNTYISRYRSAARRSEVVGIPDGLEVQDRRDPDALEDRLRAREIFGWIADLPETLAAPLVAVDVAGLTLAEAASALDLREREVHAQLSRARIAIGARLRPALVAARA